MRISQTGLDLIKEFEGCRLKAYRCPADVWTIGYGHTKTAERGMEISQDEAERLLISDMARYEYAVLRRVKKGITLRQCQFDALVSFAYNCGEGNLKKIMPYVNRKQFNTVPSRLMLYKKARVNGRLTTLKGLVRRRRAECELWRGLRGDDEPLGEMPQSVEPAQVERNPIKNSWTLKGAFMTLMSLVAGFAESFQNLPPTTQALLGVAAIGGCIVIFRRWDANRKGKIG